VNDAPVAVNDSFTTAEDTTLNVVASGVLSNDTDVDGDTLSAVLVSGPANGSLTLNTNQRYYCNVRANDTAGNTGAPAPTNAINATIAIFRMPMIFSFLPNGSADRWRTSWPVLPNRDYHRINGWLSPHEIPALWRVPADHPSFESA